MARRHPVPEPNYVIRRATALDAASLGRLRLELFREVDADPTPERAAEFEALCDRTITRFIGTGAAAAWLAEPEGAGEAFGSIVLLSFPRLPTLVNPIDAEGYLVSVYVAPAWRRRGIASALTAAAVDFARASGLGRLRLHASESGRPIYERAGFSGRDDEMELSLRSARPRRALPAPSR